MKLNLGCNDDLRRGFLNVDSFPPAVPPGFLFQRWDLREHWKAADSSVEYIVAKDVFEHIDTPRFPGSKGIIWCMNEAHRVLRPGGLLELVVPCLPGVTPWVDPTHVQVWTADTRYYFGAEWNHQKGERGRLGPGMGITAVFKTVGGKSFKRSLDGTPDWVPVQYAADNPSRYKLFLLLEAVK